MQGLKRLRVDIRDCSIWTEYCNAVYLDKKGTERDWEFIRRRGEVETVAILATLKPSNDIILIKQYRPSLDKWTIELPAGLVDKGETLEEGALRELKEETGYTGRIEYISPYLCNTPGLSDEVVRLVFVSVDEGAVSSNQSLEETEAIKVLRVYPDEINAFFEGCIKDGCVIDAKVWSLLNGYGNKCKEQG
jgi:ADP-ribose pyrophosphatase